MKKAKDFKQLGIGERLKLTEGLGAKVAKIINVAREKCNILLKPTGYAVNIKVDFYSIADTPKEELKTEVING